MEYRESYEYLKKALDIKRKLGYYPLLVIVRINYLKGFLNKIDRGIYTSYKNSLKGNYKKPFLKNTIKINELFRSSI